MKPLATDCPDILRCVPPGPLSETRFEHCGELGKLERLYQEIVRTTLQRGHRFRDPPVSTDDYGYDLRILVQCTVEHSHAIGIGKTQVDDHRVEPEALQVRQGGRCVTGLSDSKAVELQRLRYQLTKVGVVFHDEYGRGILFGHSYQATRCRGFEETASWPISTLGMMETGAPQ